ncbi:hypothetical protein EVAR_76989_1 [Eumeta japonica]|uniref:Luciferin 4-monooxygenase n=1 Tax=Eumeta variegata TaxID=151549 RepID=A0A4C1SF90_EUMVA|nr:hypothetical protein EVAR_76989_1 [Eumeta japonica]
MGLPILSFSHADRLSDAKQLRGGVVFVDSLPLTSTGKVARVKLGEHLREGQRSGGYARALVSAGRCV